MTNEVLATGNDHTAFQDRLLSQMSMWLTYPTVMNKRSCVQHGKSSHIKIMINHQAILS